MADNRDKDIMKDDSAAPESRDDKAKPNNGKKKKKKRGCGFFILSILLASGAAAGIQASGGYDFRPYVYEAVPKIPTVGKSLADLLGVPEIYSLTVDERRRIELDEWERKIALEMRSIDLGQKGIAKASKDISLREKQLEADQLELAQKLEALSADAGDQETAGSDGKKAELEEVIKTVKEMSPKNAAAILEKTDPNLVVTVLEGMPQDTRAKILGRMTPEFAAKLMEQLSTRTKKAK